MTEPIFLRNEAMVEDCCKISDVDIGGWWKHTFSENFLKETSLYRHHQIIFLTVHPITTGLPL